MAVHSFGDIFGRGMNGALSGDRNLVSTPPINRACLNGAAFFGAVVASASAPPSEEFSA
jgi:hypothetical protein